jgi:ribonucleoside-diphosphate reductase subunit M2
MESPVKKLNFSASNKENNHFDTDLASLEAEIDAKHSTKSANKNEEAKTSTVATIKHEEMDEPLLRENPQRFVMFPIKYHEVRDASNHPFRRVKWVSQD